MRNRKFGDLRGVMGETNQGGGSSGAQSLHDAEMKKVIHFLGEDYAITKKTTTGKKVAVIAGVAVLGFVVVTTAFVVGSKISNG